jgi:NAD(P)H-flavin reductase
MVWPVEDATTALVLPHAAEVVVTRREAIGAITHEIVWPEWTGCAPGQFNMLGLPDLGEIPVSVSGGIAADGPVMHTIRAAGPVSEALTRLEPGSALTIRGPFGQPWPLDTLPLCPVLIVARGIGIAALRPVIQHFARKAERGLPVRLVVGARSPDHLVAWRDYDDWRARGVDLVLTVDRAPQGWPWHVGVMRRFIGIRAGHRAARRFAYVCGPDAMMQATAGHLVAQGLAASDIFVSLERHAMPCGVGHCGGCQIGPVLLCREGPVLSWDRARPLLGVTDP